MQSSVETHKTLHTENETNENHFSPEQTETYKKNYIKIQEKLITAMSERDNEDANSEAQIYEFNVATSFDNLIQENAKLQRAILGINMEDEAAVTRFVHILMDKLNIKKSPK